MAKNTSLEALKERLFETLEGVKNLSDPNASDCEKTSIEQAEQIVAISESIIDACKVQVDAARILSKAENIQATATAVTDMGILEMNPVKQLN